MDDADARLRSNAELSPEWVTRQLGVSRVELGEALHKIERDAGLSPRDRVSIRRDGSATGDGDSIPP
jgi:DNA-binding GntR family transcriptional regulator